MSRALNRKFVRIALGGERDTAGLKGHRRTYIGAVPGKVIQAMRTAGSENPVILIDEIDKLCQSSIQGDPTGVLLEILDPQQNSAFTDDYVDVPVDLSKVLFLCTANNLQAINKTLLDRLEVVHVSGYTHDEKKHIADKYLIPLAIEKAGLKGSTHFFQITDAAIDEIIANYCREPGMRSLQRAITRITEKLAYKVVSGTSKITVEPSNVEEFINMTRLPSARLYAQTPVVSVGLGLCRA